MSGALLAAARAVAAVTPWATVLVLVFLLGHRLARGHVAARTFRLVWLVLALRLALPGGCQSACGACAGRAACGNI